MTMLRPSMRIARPLALALAVSACYVTSAAPRSRIATRRAPVPVSVLICGAVSDSAIVMSLDTALFERVTRDPAAPADLVASVRTVARKDRTILSFGLFLWTLGVIPWVTSARQDVEVLFRRPTPGVASCDPPAVPADTSGAAGIAGAAGTTGGLAIRASGGMASVMGWAGLLLQPTPWLSSDNVNLDRPPADMSANLRKRLREELSRAIIARASELQSLAGR